MDCIKIEALPPCIAKQSETDQSNLPMLVDKNGSDQVGTESVQKMNKTASLPPQKPIKHQSVKRKRTAIPKWEGPDIPTIGVNAKRIGGKSVSKGGHPAFTIEMSFAETTYIEHSAIVAGRNGTPLNCMATVHVKGVGLNKEPYQNSIKSLVRKLKKYGLDHYGISIYERRRHNEAEDREMHLHHWFHCPEELMGAIRKFIEKGSTQRIDRHFRATHSGTFGYLTKCHASMEPSTAKRLRDRQSYRYYNREAGDFIKGRRFNLTTPLRRVVDLPYPPSIRVMPKKWGQTK